MLWLVLLQPCFIVSMDKTVDRLADTEKIISLVGPAIEAGFPFCSVNLRGRTLGGVSQKSDDVEKGN